MGSVKTSVLSQPCGGGGSFSKSFIGGTRHLKATLSLLFLPVRKKTVATDINQETFPVQVKFFFV